MRQMTNWENEENADLQKVNNFPQAACLSKKINQKCVN